MFRTLLRNDIRSWAERFLAELQRTPVMANGITPPLSAPDPLREAGDAAGLAVNAPAAVPAAGWQPWAPGTGAAVAWAPSMGRARRH